MRKALVCLFILGLALGHWACGKNLAPAAPPPPSSTSSGVEGQTWNFTTLHAAFPGRESATALAYLGKMWILGGQTSAGVTGDSWYSPDGLTWSQATTNAFPARANHASVVFNNQMWVIGGYDGTNFLND